MKNVKFENSDSMYDFHPFCLGFKTEDDVKKSGFATFYLKIDNRVCLRNLQGKAHPDLEEGYYLGMKFKVNASKIKELEERFSVLNKMYEISNKDEQLKFSSTKLHNAIKEYGDIVIIHSNYANCDSTYLYETCFRSVLRLEEQIEKEIQEKKPFMKKEELFKFKKTFDIQIKKGKKEAEIKKENVIEASKEFLEAFLNYFDLKVISEEKRNNKHSLEEESSFKEIELDLGNIEDVSIKSTLKITTELCIDNIISYLKDNNLGEKEDLIGKNWKRESKKNIEFNRIKANERIFSNKITNLMMKVISTEDNILSIIPNAIEAVKKQNFNEKNDIEGFPSFEGFITALNYGNKEIEDTEEEEEFDEYPKDTKFYFDITEDEEESEFNIEFSLKFDYLSPDDLGGHNMGKVIKYLNKEIKKYKTEFSKIEIAEYEGRENIFGIVITRNLIEDLKKFLQEKNGYKIGGWNK